MPSAAAAAERAARESHARLIAWLAARSGDIAAAEDALSDAFRRALEVWPERGIPERPEAWLLTTARRRLADAARRGAVRDQATADLVIRAEERAAWEPHAMPDERLKLLFVCAHPAIAPAMRTPLMLQTVLGLDAARIGAAFLVAPSTMGQRLSRAKARIRAAGLRFAAPEPEDLPARLTAVMEAIYAGFGEGWDSEEGADPRRAGLAGEACYLADLLTRLMPDEPEPLGLSSLMLFCEARRPARRRGGRYVPLSEQDPAQWSAPLLSRAEATLARAAAMARPGRFQYEAALQSAHCERVVSGRANWPAILTLYNALIAAAPSLGARIARAAALAQVAGPGAALEELDDLGAEDHQPLWALRAHLLARHGRREAAKDAYFRAAGLTEDASARAFLLDRAARLV